MKKIEGFKRLRGKIPAASNIIAVGGGKGGVGKSFVSSNIAIFLANMGFKTVIVDLDLGAANLHTCLGEHRSKKGLSEFLNSNSNDISKFLTPTEIPKLSLLTGSNDPLDMANIDLSKRSQLMSSIFHLKTDYTVLDLSAGTHNTTLDFFLMAQKQIVTLTPEPSSIENAYRFMKAAFFRRIHRYSIQLQINKTIEDVMAECDKYGVKSPADLLNFINEKDKRQGQQLMELMEKLKFHIVLNQTRSNKDATLGNSIESICRKYFGVPAELLGALDYDNAVWQSLRKHRPLLLEYPHTRIYTQLLGMAREIANPQTKKAVV